MANVLTLPQPPDPKQFRGPTARPGSDLAQWAVISKGKLEINSLKNARLFNDLQSEISNVANILTDNVVLASAVSFTSGTAANVASLSLTSGKWDVAGALALSVAAGTTLTAVQVGVTTASATLPSAPADGIAIAGWVGTSTGTGGSAVALPTDQARVSIANTGTVYLVGEAKFSGSTCSGYGYLRARYAGTFS